jgi:hypothetical protein
MPFKVPNVRMLVALFVKRMVLQGNANTLAKSLRNSNASWQAIWDFVVGSKAVNGVRRYVSGNSRDTILYQNNAP